MVRKSKPRSKLSNRKQNQLILFLVVFAAIASTLLLKSRAAVQYADYPPHHAICVSNTPSKSSVRPGETFYTTVQMKNNGQSTWSPNYGFYLGSLTTGPVVWNVSGNSLTTSVAPNASKTFHLTVKATNTPGTYGFNWDMAIVFQGFLHSTGCSGKTVRVMNPPSVSVSANNKSSGFSLTKGSSLTIRWSSSGSTSCSASGSWSGSITPLSSGSRNRTTDTSSTGTKTYKLTCSNAVGSGSDTIAVKIVNPPTQNPPPATPPSSGGSSQPSSPSSTPASSTEDKKPPAAPIDLSAVNTDDSTVSLSWSAADSGDVASYQLERSTDKKKWHSLADTLTDQAYSDTTVSFETTYYYRVRSIDAAGNKSSYITVEIATGQFNANVLPDETATLTSEDGVISIEIPQEAVSVPALCLIRGNTNVLAPEVKGLSVISGPDELLCKNADGEVIEQLLQPATLTVKFGEQTAKYKTMAYYTYADNWQAVGESTTDNPQTMELKDNLTFAVLGHSQGSPLWRSILIGLLIAALIIGGVFVLLALATRFRARNSLNQKYEDYRRKERGL